MAMPLDELLAEVDRWKQAVSDQMAGLSPAERARYHLEARAWLEEKLGRPLKISSPRNTIWDGSQENRSSQGE